MSRGPKTTRLQCGLPVCRASNHDLKWSWPLSPHCCSLQSQPLDAAPGTSSPAALVPVILVSSICFAQHSGEHLPHKVILFFSPSKAEVAKAGRGERVHSKPQAGQGASRPCPLPGEWPLLLSMATGPCGFGSFLSDCGMG